MRLPAHIGIIPDENRRWARSNGLPKLKGWERGIDPGYVLFRLMQKTGIEEVTFYGYTMENARRPIAQRNAIIDACIEGVTVLSKENAELPVQSAYADIFVVDELWPDFTPRHFTRALEWYSQQDLTLGG
jgi:undecaprenyl diphosphate synthase